MLSWIRGHSYASTDCLKDNEFPFGRLVRRLCACTDRQLDECSLQTFQFTQGVKAQTMDKCSLQAFRFSQGVKVQTMDECSLQTFQFTQGVKAQTMETCRNCFGVSKVTAQFSFSIIVV